MPGTDAAQQPTAPRQKSRLLSAALLLAIGYAMFQLIAPQTLGETARRHFLEKLRTAYPGLAISIRRGSFAAETGLIFEDVVISDPSASNSLYAPQRMLHIDRLVVISDFDPQKMLNKEVPLVTRQIVIDGLQADAWIGNNGKLSLDRLLPIPQFGPVCPRIDVRRATVQLIDLDGHRRPIEIKIDQALIEKKSGVGSEIETRIALAGRSSFAQALKLNLTSIGGHTGGLAEIKNARLDRELFDSLPQQYRALTDELRSLDCRTDLRSKFSLSPDQPISYEITAKVHEGRFSHPNLPFDMTQLRGAMTLTPTGIELGPSQALLGDSHCRFKGTVGGYQWPCDLSLDVTADGLMLDDRLASVLPARLRENWRKLQPVGRVDVSGTISHQLAANHVTASLLNAPAPPGNWTSDGTIICKGVDVRYDRFPYPIQQLVGRIDVGGNIASTKSLNGRIGGRQLRLAFQLPTKPGVTKQKSFVMDTDGPIAINDTLLAAFTPWGQTESTKLETFMRSLRPGGSIELVRGEIATDSTGYATRHFDLKVSGGNVRYKKFPLQLHNVSGRIVVSNDIVSIKEFRASDAGSGTVTCEGMYRMPPSNSPAPTPGGGYKITDAGIIPNSQQTMALSFDVANLPLDGSLRSSLPKSNLVIWDAISPSGVVDHLHVNIDQANDNDELQFNFRATQNRTNAATSRTLSIQPESIPYRLDITGGVFEFDGREVKIHSAQARHDASYVSADGRCVQDQSGRWVLALNLHSGSRLHPDAELIAALPNQMKAAIRQLQLRGPLSLRGTTSIMLVDELNPEPIIDWDLRLQLEGNRIGDVGPVHSLRGEMTVQGNRDANRLLARGQVSIDSMNIYDLQVTGIGGPFLIQDDLLLMGSATRTSTGDGANSESQSIRGRIFDGSIDLNGSMKLSSGAFDVGIDVRSAQVQTVLADLGQSNNDWTGTLTSRINFEGILGDIDLLKGTGRARVSGANLYELPLLVQVLNQLRVSATEDVAFTDGYAAFTMFGDQITFSQLQLWGNLVALHGGGTMNRLREVDLSFNTRVSPQNMFTRAVRPLRDSPYTLWTIDVRGPIDTPTIERRALDGVGQTLERLFPGISNDSDTPADQAASRSFRVFR